MRIESDLIDLVLSSWDGDGATAGGGADVADVHLARRAEERDCREAKTPEITLSDERMTYSIGEYDPKNHYASEEQI